MGNLWVKERLYPGNVYPSKGYEQLIRTVLKLLPEGTRGYFLMDSAYYKKGVVKLLKEVGQDYFISVILRGNFRPLPLKVFFLISSVFQTLTGNLGIKT